LRDGRVEAVTDGMLPEANIAFLDEVFLGSTAILNTLLSLLNERVFRRGAQVMQVPLWTCVAASNALPEDPMLAAFADRFLINTFVHPVDPDHMPDLLRAGWAMNTAQHAVNDPLTPQEIDDLSARVLAIDLSQITDAYTHIVAKLTVRGLRFSDRRLVRGQKLIAAAALLAGRDTAVEADLWPIVYMIQDRALQEQAKELLAEELQKGENPVLDTATKHAAYGPAAYAADLAQAAQALLEDKPQLRDDPAFERWAIKAEGQLARIDAGFSDDTRPETLTLARTGLAAALT